MPQHIFKSTLFKNIFSLTFLQGINYLLPLVTVPYLVRVLGPEGFGIIGFSFAFIQYFVIITDYGFNFSATRLIAVGKQDPEVVSRIFSSVIIIKAGFLIISFLLLILIVNVFPKIKLHSEIFYLTFLMAVGNAVFPIWLFQGLQEMEHITWINILSKILLISGIFLFVKTPQQLNIAAALQASSFLIVGLLGLIFAIKRYRIRFKWPKPGSLVEQLKEGWPIFLSTASISLYSNTNIVLLGFLSNEKQVGYYVAADKIIKAAQALLNPISQAIYPHINQLARSSKAEAIVFVRKAFRFLGLGALLISICLLGFATPIIYLALGKDYEPSITLLKWMSPLPLAIALSNVLGVQTMLSFGLNKEFMRSIVLSSLLNLFLVVPLTLWLQAQGTAIAILITEIFVTGYMWYLLSKKNFRMFGVLQNGF